jgi:hypothetical protein
MKMGHRRGIHRSRVDGGRTRAADLDGTEVHRVSIDRIRPDGRRVHRVGRVVTRDESDLGVFEVRFDRREGPLREAITRLEHGEVATDRRREPLRQRVAVAAPRIERQRTDARVLRKLSEEAPGARTTIHSKGTPWSTRVAHVSATHPTDRATVTKKTPCGTPCSSSPLFGLPFVRT